MSDLREAIAVALRAELASMQDEGLIGTIDGWVVPRLVGVFEAYLREHDAQSQATGVKIVNDVIAANVLAERERIRQRIKVLPCSSPVPAYKSGYEDAQTDALEAIKEDT